MQTETLRNIYIHYNRKRSSQGDWVEKKHKRPCTSYLIHSYSRNCVTNTKTFSSGGHATANAVTIGIQDKDAYRVVTAVLLAENIWR